MTLRVSEWQSESDLDSIRNSCNVSETGAKAIMLNFTWLFSTYRFDFLSHYFAVHKRGQDWDTNSTIPLWFLAQLSFVPPPPWSYQLFQWHCVTDTFVEKKIMLSGPGQDLQTWTKTDSSKYSGFFFFWLPNLKLGMWEWRNARQPRTAWSPRSWWGSTCPPASPTSPTGTRWTFGKSVAVLKLKF